ncbi:MAG: hypothetical protein LUI08_07695 [Prevotella sp.]|nr:hypothetical protein [Prevotella sp.]
MKKKEYFSPKSTLVVLDSRVLGDVEDGGALGGNGGSGGDNEAVAGKGMSDWQEPEYDDDGFGW